MGEQIDYRAPLREYMSYLRAAQLSQWDPGQVAVLDQHAAQFAEILTSWGLSVHDEKVRATMAMMARIFFETLDNVDAVHRTRCQDADCTATEVDMCDEMEGFFTMVHSSLQVQALAEQGE